MYRWATSSVPPLQIFVSVEIIFIFSSGQPGDDVSVQTRVESKPTQANLSGLDPAEAGAR